MNLSLPAFMPGLVVAALVTATAPCPAGSPAPPWADASLSPERRAAQLLGAMTQDEKLGMVHGGLGAPWGQDPKPPEAVGSAGFIPGVPRLKIPPLQETDAELGVGNPGLIRKNDTATAMPSNLALASTWDPALARQQGAAVGAEARAKGFNVLLGGTANLIRDPRGGRNFEYLSEDPLLTGIMAGEEVAGVQENRIISTVKHFALNAQETDRVVLDGRIDPAAMRESDLLAFELAIERGHPYSVMCAYNQVNGHYSCENGWLLDRVLKGDWRFAGFVMSDWGAVHSTLASALAGLDQESGEQLDTENFFGAPLARAIEEGAVPQARLDDMVARILTAIVASGAYDDAPKPGPSDPAVGAATAQTIAEAGTVLLKNDRLLPLRRDIARIAIIGPHADRGVLSGGGSSQVVPTGGIAATEAAPNGFPGALVFDPSSPLDAVRQRAPGASVTYDDGGDLEAAVRHAAASDVALVFAEQWTTETADVPDLSLPEPQDRLIEAVARANPRTVVVLETGDPVAMPWLDRVAGVLEAWYPGQRGGVALARILFGDVDPSGHLPVTFPRSERQLPRPKMPGDPAGAPRGPVGRGGSYGQIYVADYTEGAAVGYKWFARTGLQPLFPFGFGLSYTRFEMHDLQAALDGNALTVSLSVANTGDRAGAAVPQVYLSGDDESSFPRRLVGWSKLDIAPGEERRFSLRADPRLLARFDSAEDRWRIEPGRYRVSVGFDAAHIVEAVDVALKSATLPP